MKRMASAWLRQTPSALLAISAGGWLLLALGAVIEPSAICRSASAERGFGPALQDLISALDRPVAPLVGWIIMLTAMMTPLLAPPVLRLWCRSLAHRRWRAIATFAFGYGAVWVIAGGALIAATTTLDADNVQRFTLAVIIAAIWQITPWKQLCLNRCHHHHPLAAFGWRAEADALRYGMSHGCWCIGACWALMLLPLAAGPWHLPVMAGVSLLILYERCRAPRPPKWTVPRWIRLRLSRLRLFTSFPTSATGQPYPGTQP